MHQVLLILSYLYYFLTLSVKYYWIAHSIAYKYKKTYYDVRQGPKYIRGAWD